MKKKIYTILIIIIILGIGTGIGWYIRNQTLNPRATIPKALESTLSFINNVSVKEDDDLMYYENDLAGFIVNGSTKTKVTVDGIVDSIAKEPDGDYHIIMHPQINPLGLYLVTEAIPEIKLLLPNVGDHIKIWGIVRFDVLHNWWELHPVIGWEKV